MRETSPPDDDLRAHVQTAARHLRIAVAIAKAANAAASGMEAYRDRMALAGAATAGVQALAPVWIWVVPEATGFKAAFEASLRLRKFAIRDELASASEMGEIVGHLETLLAEIEPALEGLTHD